jgi:ribosomal protein S18 acetylase RimI-like enzyme
MAGGDVEALPRFHESLSESTRRRFTPHAYDPATIGGYLKRSRAGEDLIFVAVTPPGEIIGYFFLWEFQSPIPLLGIGLTDGWQGEGLGRQMMELLIDQARKADRDGIELTTMPDNERAFGLYQACGFRYLGDVENVTGDGRIVVERKMFLPLKPTAEPSVRKFKPPL